MNIILTGATGFIGTALVPRLVAEGHNIVLLSRDAALARRKFRTSITIEEWDGQTLGPWVSIVDGADAVVNFAGESLDARRWSQAQKERIVHSRLYATSAIVQSIKQASRKPAVLVNASGIGYYGHVQSGEVDETSPRGTDFLSEVVYRWETEARKAEEAGVRTVLLRTAVVLGGDGGALRKMVIPFKLFVGGPLGSGRQWFPWIHREDLVRVVMFSLSATRMKGAVNAVAPEVVTMREFCRTLGRVLGRRSWAPVPSFVLKAVLGEMSSMVLTGQRAIPRVLEQLGYRFKFPYLESALRDIL